MPACPEAQLTDSIEFHRAEEWTAVYLNGMLERVGHHYLADEWLETRYGVKVVDDDAFMRGQNHRDGVAVSLDEVAEYAASRDDRLAVAAEKRAQAARLAAEADAIETAYR